MTIIIGEEFSTVEACRAAQSIIEGRYTTARKRLEQLNGNLTARLLDLAAGRIDAAVLDAETRERTLLREMLNEDPRPILDELTDKIMCIVKDTQRRVNAETMRQQHLEFAAELNSFLEGYQAPSPHELQRLQLKAPQQAREILFRLSVNCVPYTARNVERDRRKFGQFVGVNRYELPE